MNPQFKLLSLTAIGKKYTKEEILSITEDFAKNGIYEVIHKIGTGEFYDLPNIPRSNQKCTVQTRIKIKAIDLMNAVIAKHNPDLHLKLLDRIKCQKHYNDAYDDISRYETGQHGQVLLKILEKIKDQMTLDDWYHWTLKGITYETESKEYISVFNRTSTWTTTARNVKVVLYNDFRTIELPDFTIDSTVDRI